MLFAYPRHFKVPINKVLLVLLIMTVALRLGTLQWLPFLDKTESRTVLASQLAMEHGNPLEMLLMVKNRIVPNWSKPPLHYWLVDLSFLYLGINEFSARLPAFLCGLISVIAISYFLSRIHSLQAGLLAGLILMSSGLFFLVMGLSLVDITLTACFTVSATAFALSFIEPQHPRRWALLSGGACGLAMISKGPVAIAFLAVTLALFSFHREARIKLRRFHWVDWLLAFGIISLPAFMLIEYHNPGFLRYFFVNENLLRYTVGDYGDKYGSGHVRAFGTIWFYLLVSFLPWTPILFLGLWRDLSSLRKFKSGPLSNLATYWLICWGLAPAFFFTLAHQHLATYLLPGFAGLAGYTAIALLDPSKALFHSILPKFLSKSHRFFIPASIILIGVGIYYQSRISDVAACLLLGTILVVALRDIRSNNIPSVLLGKAALGVVILLSISVISISNYCNGFASTKEILSILKTNVRDGSLIHFPVSVPNSAFLYTKAISSVKSGSGEPAICSDKMLCVARQKDLNNPEIKMPSIDRLFSKGKWVVFEKSSS